MAFKSIRRALLVGAAVAASVGLSACGGSTNKFSDAVQTSDYQISTMPLRPYGRVLENVLDLNDPKKPVDENGVLIVDNMPDIEGRVYHPVNMTQHALYALESYLVTGDNAYLERAEANTQALLDGSEVIDGARWFPYRFDYVLHQMYDMPAPWFSGMAQGLGLSLLTRMYEVTGDKSYANAAHQVFASFTEDATADRMFLNEDEDHNLWFEEYVAAAYPPSHVVNGHIYALFGLYDYALEFDNKEALHLFDAGATTMLNTFDQWRKEDDYSYYCASSLCWDTGWQPTTYHRGVIRQLEDLALMTGDRKFLDEAKVLIRDAANAPEVAS